MKITTIRLPLDLDKQLTNYAKANELSKNQVIKYALRILLKLESGCATHEE